MIRLMALLATSAAIGLASPAIAQNSTAPVPPRAQGGAAHGATPPADQGRGGAVDRSAMTCAEFSAAAGRDYAGIVAELSDQARQARLPESARANPLPGYRFAPVPMGPVVGACNANPAMRVAEVVDSEVATSN